MAIQSTSETLINSTLELIRICERIREILRGTGVDDNTASAMRSCQWHELQYDPVVWVIYNRGWYDWTAGVTLIYNAPSLTSRTTATSLQPIKRTEYGMERYVRESELELEELMQRRRVIVESQGGESNAMLRIAVVAISFPVAKIRSYPILWAVYSRGWEDRAAVEDINRMPQQYPADPA